MEIKRILSLGLFLCLLMASCDNIDEPEKPNGDLVEIEFCSPEKCFEPLDGFEANTRYDNPYRDFARAMTALNLDEIIIKEIYDAVSRSVDCGLDEVYFFREALGEDSKVFAKQSNVGRLLKAKLEAFPDNDAVKYINEFWGNYADKDRFQIYWPYSENWDGKTMPKFAAKSVVYSVSESGLLVIEDMLTDEYAKKNPVLVINDSPIRYSEIPDFAVTNYVKQDKITTIYYPTYKYGENIENVSNYLTNNDIDSYFANRKEKVYSLWLESLALTSLQMDKAVSGGGVYMTCYVANFDGMKIVSQSDLDNSQPNYWANRFCIRRQFCKYDQVGEFVTANILLSGDANLYVMQLPTSVYIETGSEIKWRSPKRENVWYYSETGEFISKSVDMPYIEYGEGSYRFGFSVDLCRPGVMSSHYGTEDLFGPTGAWSASAAYTIKGCSEGGVTPDWMK